MKRNTKILIKTTALVLAFMLLLGVGIMSLSFSHSGVKPNDDNFLTPDLAITAPTSQELLQRKFNAYNTVTEDNGKSVVTIFSEEQIKDFNDRRNNGEWFWLSSEEMLFLINNTVELFKTYDIVYIRDLDGNLNKYYGLSFFSSVEYYASFNGFDLGIMDASFDLKKDIYETILTRCSIFNSICLNIADSLLLYSDISVPLTNAEIEQLKLSKNPFFKEKDVEAFGAWSFSSKSIYYTHHDFKKEYLSIFDNGVEVFEVNDSLDGIGYFKYDQSSGQVVVIELYEEKKQQLVARIRLDSEHNPTEISEIQSKYKLLVSNISNSESLSVITDYRVVIYLNGFVFNNEPVNAIRCSGDMDNNLFVFCTSNDVFSHNYLYLKGNDELIIYIKQILNKYLTNK